MKEVSMTLILILLLYWPPGIKIEADSRSLSSHKGAVSNEKEPPSKERAETQATSLKRSKDDSTPQANEDCGCETSLFGEPVIPGENGPSKEGSDKVKGNQELKTKAKSERDLKPGSKSETKEGTRKKQGKPGAASADTNRPKKAGTESGKI